MQKHRRGGGRAEFIGRRDMSGQRFEIPIWCVSVAVEDKFRVKAPRPGGYQSGACSRDLGNYSHHLLVAAAVGGILGQTDRVSE